MEGLDHTRRTPAHGRSTGTCTPWSAALASTVLAAGISLATSACSPASSGPGTGSTVVQQQESDAGAVLREALGSTRVVILGTGTPTADPERSGPCVAIVVNGTPYLVDLGPGVIRRAAAAVQAGVFELDPINLRHAFITHLHSDHTVGYPDLIFSPWALGRDWSIDVWGPTGIAAMTDHLMAAYEQDIEIRMDGEQPSTTEGFRVRAHEVEPGVVHEDDNVTVEAFLVSHGTWPEAYGYKFTTPDKTIVISGDTGPSDVIVQQCDGCDILIHEVYSSPGFELRPDDWQAYHESFHTSAPELAGIATRARPRLLVLYHQLFWGATDEGLLAEIRAAGYEGEVVSARDLDIY